MKYIEKKNLDDANRIIDPYLSYAKEQRWFLTEDIYKNHFTSRWRKRDLIDSILLSEQDYRCCYCMKRLNPIKDPEATIEHLIPRSASNGLNFSQYFDTDYPGLNRNYVCHTDNYKKGTSNEGQYPHHVAYHNFAIACHDCNEKRGNSFIIFPFLLPPDKQKIDYNRKTGEITLVDESCSIDDSIKIISMINKVGLNGRFSEQLLCTTYGQEYRYPLTDTITEYHHLHTIIA